MRVFSAAGLIVGVALASVRMLSMRAIVISSSSQ